MVKNMSEENKQPKVIPIVDNWYLGADSYCLILYRAKKITGAKAKEENLGKIDFVPVGYYTTLSAVYDAIAKAELRDAINSNSVKTMEDVMKKMDAFVGHVKALESKFLNELEKRGKAKCAT